MQRGVDGGELIIRASVAKHLAFAPVAFAVTEGPSHVLLYGNALFRMMQARGDIRLAGGTEPAVGADLRSVLDTVYGSTETVRDALIAGSGASDAVWSCTVWPVPASGDIPQKLVIEIRDARMIEQAKARQRAIAERLLLGALREQDVARDAEDAGKRSLFLARASRELSMSLDEPTTRETVRRLTLPRPGTWCIVDVVESNGGIHRLAIDHPDPDKRELTRQLETQWPAKKSDTMTTATVVASRAPTVVSDESGAALMLAAHGDENLRILRKIGFGYLLVVPLIVRARVQGAITFVSRQGDPAFSSDEIALAVDVASRCALALDNARLYREADALRVAAERANQSKSQFLGSMSHELRTPLNAIGGFAELMDLGIQGPVTDDQHVALARIMANQKHLLSLITEILNFVRIESGRMEYQLGEVRVAPALAEVAGMLSGVVADRGLRMEGPPADPDAVAWADPDRVRQIFMNLIMNAVKYAGEKPGTVTLTTTVIGDTVTACVADTGPGIAPEKLESIFEPFVQLTAGLADRRGGVGLGLAISRDLARAMGGDLSVESTLGAGCRFTLTLPRARSGANPA
jgi:signal transduction histidine kinase